MVGFVKKVGLGLIIPGHFLREFMRTEDRGSQSVTILQDTIETFMDSYSVPFKGLGLFN